MFMFKNDQYGGVTVLFAPDVACTSLVMNIEGEWTVNDQSEPQVMGKLHYIVS